MGLIYNPSDSRGIVSALNGNIRTAEEMVEGLNRASRHLINALNGKELSGAAYTAGKGMFSQLVIPTISKASEALEKLKSETKKYEGFASSAGDELLDEDKLNEKLQSLQAQQAALSSQIDFFKQQAMSHKEDSGLSTSFTNYSNTLSSYMSAVADDIQEVQKKLKKLHEFNSNVNGLFSEVKSNFETVANGIKGIGGAVLNNGGTWLNPIQGNYKNGKWQLSSKDIYSSVQYGRAVMRKWKNNPGSFTKGTVFSKGGAQIEDLKIFGKSIVKNDSKIGKVFNKLPSYSHGSINRDLSMMRENSTAWSGMSKIGKSFKVAGYVGTALDVGASVNELKSQGFSNEQTAVITARRTAVDFGATAVGQTAGRVAGAAIGQALIPIPGVGAAVGAVAGSVLGGVIGSWIGGAINANFDKGVKPKKQGWSWPW